MSGDHNADINKGNYNELIEGDYMGTQSNLGTNIQKAENVTLYIRGEGNSDASNSNVSKSSANICKSNLPSQVIDQ